MTGQSRSRNNYWAFLCRSASRRCRIKSRAYSRRARLHFAQRYCPAFTNFPQVAQQFAARHSLRFCFCQSAWRETDFFSASILGGLGSLRFIFALFKAAKYARKMRFRSANEMIGDLNRGRPHGLRFWRWLINHAQFPRVIQLAGWR